MFGTGQSDISLSEFTNNWPMITNELEPDFIRRLKTHITLSQGYSFPQSKYQHMHHQLHCVFYLQPSLFTHSLIIVIWINIMDLVQNRHFTRHSVTIQSGGAIPAGIDKSVKEQARANPCWILRRSVLRLWNNYSMASVLTFIFYMCAPFCLLHHASAAPGIFASGDGDGIEFAEDRGKFFILYLGVCL